MAGLVILAISIILQLGAAVLALRLIPWNMWWRLSKLIGLVNLLRLCYP